MTQNDLLLMRGMLEALETTQDYEPGTFKIYDKDGNQIDEFTDVNPQKFDTENQVLDFIKEIKSTFKLSETESRRLTSCENIISGTDEDIAFCDLDVLLKLSGRKDLSEEVVFKCIAAYEYLSQNLDVLDTDVHYPHIIELASEQAELMDSIFTPILANKYDVACDSN